MVADCKDSSKGWLQPAKSNSIWLLGGVERLSSRKNKTGNPITGNQSHFSALLKKRAKRDWRQELGVSHFSPTNHQSRVFDPLPLNILKITTVCQYEILVLNLFIPSSIQTQTRIFLSWNILLSICYWLVSSEARGNSLRGFWFLEPIGAPLVTWHSNFVLFTRESFIEYKVNFNYHCRKVSYGHVWRVNQGWS